MGQPRFEEHELGLSWLADRGELMQRASHCIRLGDRGGKVWVVDPVDVAGIDERIAAVAAGDGVAGVLQLLDRHRRDCAAFAERLGAPLHRLPFAGIEGSGLEPVKVVDHRLWREVAIHAPADRALIVPEAVGTARYFRAGDEEVGVHPMLRALPPTRLADFRPVHLLTGHGTGMHGPATAPALAEALAASRRRIPGAIASMVRARAG